MTVDFAESVTHSTTTHPVSSDWSGLLDIELGFRLQPDEQLTLVVERMVEAADVEIDQRDFRFGVHVLDYACQAFQAEQVCHIATTGCLSLPF